VLDALLFGGESLFAYLAHPSFTFHEVDVAVANRTSVHS
jgi:hypothetical protein